MESTIHSLTEFAHINEMQADLKRKLGEAVEREVGHVDSLRSSILASVVGESYDRAAQELQSYVEAKESYPNFQERAERYVQHCGELIQAIQTKRAFPGLASLSLAKQQEIHERVLRHFEDLKQHLRQIEKIERDCKLNDVRSTVWVLRAFCYATVLIFVTAFLLDLRMGAFSSAWTVLDSAVDSLCTWIVTLVKV